jgi:hypothetical protein
MTETMKFARIVGSNSHVTYVARLLDDAAQPSDDSPAGFGTFVAMDVQGEKLIGAVCDSRLVNPEYSPASPRIGQANALADLKRDQIDEQKALVAILLLGSSAAGEVSHEVPKRVIPSGTEVFTLSDDEVRAFHTDSGGGLILHYLPNLIAHTGSLATPLTKYLIARLSPLFSDDERRRLDVMYSAIQWKHAMTENRF